MPKSESKKAKAIIICGQQRSGTTVLARTMASSPFINNFGEVFQEAHYGSPDHKQLFFNFRKQLLEKDLNLAFPSFHNQQRIFKAYQDHLTNLSNDYKYYLIGVKYNSWHHFDTVWQTPLTPPYLLAMSMEQNIPIVHVKRKNRFLQYLSARFARKAKLWHLEAGSTDTVSPKTTIEIDPEKCLKRMELSNQLSLLFKEWTESYDKVVDLCYEDMIENNKFSAKTMDSIDHLVGEKLNIPLEPKLKKVLNSPKKIVENKEELLRFFSNTKYGKQVVEALVVG
jgi:LPS sulfotransferase NodH